MHKLCTLVLLRSNMPLVFVAMTSHNRGIFQKIELFRTWRRFSRKRLFKHFHICRDNCL